MQKNCFSYPVELVEDAFGEGSALAEILRKVTGSDQPKALIVADLNVVQRNENLGSKIGRYVKAHDIWLMGSPVVLSGGEKVKSDNLQSVMQIVTALLAAKLGKNDVVLVMGGGTILDVAGYAAAQVRGGIKVVRIPTTPAAMLDAAYADYAAIDSTSVKDALRVPAPPAAVIIDTGLAASVLDGVWRGGISEAVRLAVASDATLMKKIQTLAPAFRDRDPEALKTLVEAVRTTRAKKGPTTFGLWSACRFEPMSGYKLPHGYAVAMGLCLDMGYAVEKGYMKAADRDKVVEVLETCGALDGLAHSGHLISQPDNLLLGLDAWTLTTGTSQIPVSKGIGKTVDDEPDREVFRQVLKKLVSAPHND